MDTLDARLRGLGAITVDPRLGAIGGAVMDGLAALRERQASRKQLVLSGVFALGIGLTASMAPGADARAAPARDGLTGAPALAPSQLLDY